MDTRSLVAYAIIAGLVLLLGLLLWRWKAGGSRREGFSPFEQFRRSRRR